MFYNTYVTSMTVIILIQDPDRKKETPRLRKPNGHQDLVLSQLKATQIEWLFNYFWLSSNLISDYILYFSILNHLNKKN